VTEDQELARKAFLTHILSSGASWPAGRKGLIWALGLGIVGAIFGAANLFALEGLGGVLGGLAAGVGLGVLLIGWEYLLGDDYWEQTLGRGLAWMLGGTLAAWTLGTAGGPLMAGLGGFLGGFFAVWIGKTLADGLWVYGKDTLKGGLIGSLVGLVGGAVLGANEWGTGGGILTRCLDWGGPGPVLGAAVVGLVGGMLIAALVGMGWRYEDYLDVICSRGVGPALAGTFGGVAFAVLGGGWLGSLAGAGLAGLLVGLALGHIFATPTWNDMAGPVCAASTSLAVGCAIAAALGGVVGGAVGGAVGGILAGLIWGTQLGFAKMVEKYGALGPLPEEGYRLPLHKAKKKYLIPGK
jgi:hypothetical protein